MYLVEFCYLEPPLNTDTQILWTVLFVPTKSLYIFSKINPLKDTSYLDRCPLEKICTRASFKKTLPHYISVESLINLVFDKNIILVTFSFAKRQKPVQTKTTGGRLFEFIGY